MVNVQKHLIETKNDKLWKKLMNQKITFASFAN